MSSGESPVADRPFWRARPTLVTGATGFVGTWLVRRLHDAGADVVCVVRDWVPDSDFFRSGVDHAVRIAYGDICDQAFIERVLGEYEIDTVMHLAAQTVVGIANHNPASTFDSNIRGTWSVLEACRRSPEVKQIVLASSDKAYGEAGTRYSEETPLRARHPYDVSKACADLIGQAYAATYDMRLAITRCGNFYGGGDLNWSRLVPGTIRSVLQGIRPIVRSNGRLVRDYFYVEDGAAAYMLLAEQLAGRPGLAGRAFNFSNGRETTVLEMTELILCQMDSSLKPDILDKARNEIEYQSLNSDRARTDLNWLPQFTMEEGVKRTIAWYRSFFQGRQPISV